MGNERLYRTEGIVIRRRDQGEADRVLTLCTPQGKIEVIARGVRKIRSRKAGHVELFSRSSFVVSRVPNSWDVVSQAETVEPHAILRDDLMRGAYARYVVELLDSFFAQDEGGPALFDLLDHTLTWLCSERDLELVTRFYEQHLLGLAGFRPELFRCVGEHNTIVSLPFQELSAEQQPHGLDPERGGALCPECYDACKAMQAIVPLSPAVLRFLQECQRGPYTRLRGYPLAPALHAEAERVMRHYITYHLERRVRSGLFLHRLKISLQAGAYKTSGSIAQLATNFTN